MKNSEQFKYCVAQLGLMKDLNAGEKFRMFEDEHQVIFGDKSEWIATHSPYVNSDGIWTVNSI